MALAALILTGCSTSSPARSSAEGPRPNSAGTAKTAKAPATASHDADIPVEAIAHFATGLIHDLTGEAGPALEEYSASALANPDYEPVVVEAVRRHLRGRKPEKAVEILVKATSSPAASGTLFAWLGLAYGQAGQKEPAIRANRTAMKKMPASLPAYQNLAQLYFQNSQTNEALRVLEGAARQPLADATFLIDLAELYARYARVQNPTNEPAKPQAVQLLDRAAKLKPANPATLQKLGDGYFQLGEFSKAEDVYSHLLGTLPQMTFLRAKLADLYLRSGKKDKAAEQLQAISREEPTNARTQAVLGALALEENKVEEGIRHLERALLLSPQMEQVYYELAGAKIINQKKPEDALALLGKARARFKPGFPMEYYSALASIALKKYGDAVKYLASAESLAKAEEPGRLTHLFYYQMGSASERNGDHGQAEKHFLKCLELAPDFADAMNYMGYMWAEQGVKLEEARVLIQRAVELEPNNAAFLDSLGWVLFRLNQPREALTYILRAVEKTEEPDATLLDHLGDIYASLYEYPSAREAWSKSLSVEANDKIKQKMEAAPVPNPSSAAR